tara:strand:- start:238 stop:858 length:621 start_codon:yes stop_codon:yes gene_type:complete
MKHSPTYYAVIPASVRYSKLKPNAKLLYGEITALSNKEGYCFATNRYFADLYGVTKNTVSLWVSQLNKLGFVSIELIKKGEQITERRLCIIKNDATPNIINNELNTIKINTTSNNISNRKEKFIEDVLKIETDQNIIKNFILYWTEENKSNTKMRFEIERTWNLKSRIERWQRSQWQTKTKNTSKIKSSMNVYSKAKEMMNKINNI